jgi:rhomboid protease GluP
VAAGEWWRLITPVLVHHGGWREVLFNFIAIAAVGVLVERWFGWRFWLVLYAVGALVGEVVGGFWKPSGAGSSVAGAGLLGGVVAWLIVRGGALPLRVRIWGGIGLAAGLLLTAMRDIHGPPIVAGAVVATVSLRRSHGRF